MNTCRSRSRSWTLGAAAGVFLLASAVAYNTYARPQGGRDSDAGQQGVRHVLLISIDGMHAVDFLNCSQGINGGSPYCPNLAALAQTGVNFVNTSTSKPSDSFPGLMALVTGGSPRTFGAFYDVAYDRSLDPPALTTGNGVVGAPNLCTPYAPPTGSSTEFDEGIDLNKAVLNGGAPTGVDGGVCLIDPRSCLIAAHADARRNVPWTLCANTIFGVVHAAGRYTAGLQASFVFFRERPGQWHERGRLLFPGDQTPFRGP